MVPETSKTIQSGSFLRQPSRSDPGPSSAHTNMDTRNLLKNIMVSAC